MFLGTTQSLEAHQDRSPWCPAFRKRPSLPKNVVVAARLVLLRCVPAGHRKPSGIVVERRRQCQDKSTRTALPTDLDRNEVAIPFLYLAGGNRYDDKNCRRT